MTTHAGSAETSSASSWAPEPATAAGGGAGALSATVVICAYTRRRWDQLGQAVGSVRAQLTPPRRIVVVVDHNDELLARATAAFLDVTVVANTGPRGLSGARNTGMAHAVGDVVAFLDDDAIAEPDWLGRLLARYADADVLAVGGRADPIWTGERPSWLPPEFDWVVGCSYRGQPATPAPVRNLIGCNMSFRRSALAGIGGFDPALGRVGRIPVGCEETELCIRLSQLHPGAVLWYEPGAVVRHLVTGDRTTWRYFHRRCFSEGRSKAIVARRVGNRAGLASERDYTRHALPAAIRRELAQGGPGWRRSAVIVAGLAVTGSGYLAGRTRRERRDRAPRPVRVATVDLNGTVPAVSDERPAGGRYAAAQILVRRHGRPLGVLEVTLPPGGLTGPALADVIERSIAVPAGDHPDAAAATSPFATVVVPTVGTAPALRRCLSSLLDLDYPHYEILVVDNAPDRSSTAALVGEFGRRDPRLRLTSEPRRGVAYARNRGLAEARGGIVAYADDDVVVDRRWLRSLVDAFVDDEVAAVTGLVLPAELETPAQIYLERYGGFGKGCRRTRFDRTGYQVTDAAGTEQVAAFATTLYPYLPGRYGSGASMAFRTDVLRRLGGFDPRLGGARAVRAGEDIDALLRVVLAGRALVYEPAAVVRHAHRGDLRSLRRGMYAYGVGLAAVLTKCLGGDPGIRREVVRRLPRGLHYALHPRSARNAGRTDGYPVSLMLAELAGLATGPVQFLRAARGRR